MNVQMLSYSAMLDMLGCSYLGSVNQSAKMMASYRNGTLTYCLYLAPSDMSGYNVCPFSKYCRDFCLNANGVNKADILAHGIDNMHNNARIKKTRVFFENKPLFMSLLRHEIERYIKRANFLNMDFSVRLNGTSDISPERFIDDESGLNILELYPNIQFYDYTKVFSRINLLKKYPNYKLTYSYNGHNENECEAFLKAGGQVAVVFYGKLPKYFCGYEVVDGNKYDMRYLDPNGVIIGLHYHKTANDYQYNALTGKREFIIPNTPFVVMENDLRCEY